MLFPNVAVFFALLASAQAFVIPEGATNGVYAVARDADGTEVHTKIVSANAERSPNEALVASSGLESRSDGRIWCGCGFSMNSDDTNAAVRDMKRQLGTANLIRSRQSYYAIHGDVVAFACSRSSSLTYTNGELFEAKMARITNACGRYIAGAYQDGNDGEELIMGYQRYKEGDDFCAASTTSPANHC